MIEYATDAAFRSALDTRLRNRARERNISIVRLRKEVIFERWLARLLRVEPEGWMLKGAVAIEFRLRDVARTSKDVDIEGFDTLEEVNDLFQQCAQLDLGDRFVFSATTIRESKMRDGSIVGTYRLVTELGGLEFDRVHSDVQVGRRPAIRAELVTGPDYLNFAGVPTVAIPTLPLPFQIAEKVHAYTRRYRDGSNSTRVRDLVDLVLIANSLSGQVVTAELASALNATFNERATHETPSALPEPPADWAIPYAAEARALGLPTELKAAHAIAAALVGPALKMAGD